MSEFYLMVAQLLVFFVLVFLLSIIILAIVNLVRGVIIFKRKKVKSLNYEEEN